MHVKIIYSYNKIKIYDKNNYFYRIKLYLMVCKAKWNNPHLYCIVDIPICPTDLRM